MKFSFLICTCNSERLISEVVSAILNQSEFNDVLEVIIVDYKSKDMTLDIANKLLESTKVDFVEINCDVPGKSPALVEGFTMARGDYVVIVDDDNILFPNYLEMAKAILKDKTIGCVGAKGVVDKNLKLSSWFNDYESVYAIGLPLGEDWVWGAGSIINIEAWKKLRRFKFDFILNPVRKSHLEPIFIGGEDVELALAIKLIGYRVVSNEKLQFIHKFQQARISEEYLVKNSEGVSRSVSVHELYRTLIGQPETLFPRIHWVLKISRKILGCSLNGLICMMYGDKLKSRVTLATMKGILLGFVKFNSSFNLEYTKLREYTK